MESQIDGHLQTAWVDVAAKVYPLVEICFGTESLIVSETLAASSFSMVKDHIERGDYAGE